MTTAADVLRFLARVVGERHDPGLTFDVRRDGPVATAATHPQSGVAGAQPGVRELLGGSRQWRRVVALHGELEPGRIGQLWLAGRGTVLGQERRLCVPLWAAHASDDRMLQPYAYEPSRVAAALDLDEGLLEAAAAATPGMQSIPPGLLRRMPRLSGLVERLEARGVVVDEVGVQDPTKVASGHSLRLCLHTSVYVDLAPLGPPSAQRLRAWADRRVADTAFGHLHRGDAGPTADPGQLAPDEPRSPLPLTGAQRAAVVTARTAPISVVSGAPGTGKSHLAVAVALDEVARGGSVLLATRSGHAADVLADLLDRHPGPLPVRIGGGTTRRDLADRLADGLPPAASDDELDRAGKAEEQAVARLRRAHDDLARLLAVAGDDDLDPAREALLRAEVPGAFTHPERELLDLLAAATPGPRDGWVRRWSRARAQRRLRAAVGAGPEADLGRIRTAVELARRRRLADRIEQLGGFDLAPVRTEFDAAAAALRTTVGDRLSRATRGAADRDGRRAVAALAAALRSGPARRAEQLARLDAGALTRTLPLWVGTVAEIDQLLPPVAGMFDLVVLDEASQLDQLVAAPVLCRARRAVVTGDPRQLRHVSFVADAEVDEALRASRVQALADVLDVRRVSAFDAAAAVAPVRWLDEHLRSVPHLIAFSARHFYDHQQLHVVTMHPSVATADAIDTLHVEPRTSGDVVTSEVDAVLAELHRLAAIADVGTVGVVTPFRAQADAIRDRVVEAFDLDTIQRLALRVGTVHGFQGGERDTVLLSLGLVEGGPPQRRAFAEDPHLLNVMVTRARRRVLVVTALPEGTGGMLGAYLDHAERPPAPPDARPPQDAWTRSLLAELLRNEVDVRPGVDRLHGVDLVAGRGTEAVGLLTRPHPDGVEADVARHTALVRAGWALLELYAVPGADPVSVALDVRHRLPTA